MTLVSIVIPAYNQARFVAQAVESALRQTHQPIEVVVVDDGSTDDTPEVLRAFADRSDVRIVRQPNAGLPAARNRGLDEAHGEFICFLDSDDRLGPRYVERLIAPLLADASLAFAYCDVQMVDDTGTPSSDFSVGAARRVVSGDIFDSLLVGGYFPPHAVLVRRSQLEQHGAFDLDLGGHADYELWLRLAAAGGRAAYVNDRLVDYRVYDGTMSRDREHMRETRIAALERVVRAHPQRVARGLSAVQELTVDLHTANVWMRDHLEPALRLAQSGQHLAAVWTLLNDFDRATLVKGTPASLAVWDTTLGGRSSQAVYLHPPSVLEAIVPTGAAGRLTASLAIHPDAWTKPQPCACTFTLDVDKVVATTALLDPARRPADQRWIEVAIDVPASPTERHVVTLETQAIGAPRFGWALFKDVRFFAAA